MNPKLNMIVVACVCPKCGLCYRQEVRPCAKLTVKQPRLSDVMLTSLIAACDPIPGSPKKHAVMICSTCSRKMLPPTLAKVVGESLKIGEYTTERPSG